MSNGKKSRQAPLPSVRRLPTYLHLLKKYVESGRSAVSCTHIASELSLTNTQVRKDLAVTGIIGKPKVGYDVGELISAITAFLGWNSTSEAFLVGAGSLGSALLGYQDFRQHGLNFVAAFDSDPRKSGQRIHGCEVLPLEEIYSLADQRRVRIGVLAVPARAAQEVANMLVLAGIKAIWNFTPATLEAPESVIVEDVRLYSSLAILTSRLSENLRETK